MLNTVRNRVIGLLGVAGLAGAGKTTGARYLSTLTAGRYLYLGQTVLDEVRARGLPETRENERKVRIDLRAEKGQAALATPRVEEVVECLKNGIPVVVDAIFMLEEFNFLRSRIPDEPAQLLAIDTSFEVRLTRLGCRPERTFSSDELRKRDDTELKVLGTDAVLKAADCTISNDGTFDDFYSRLAEFVRTCA